MTNMVDRLGGASSSLAFKAPCRVATTEHVSLSGFMTIDGVLPTSAQHPDLRRILVKSQNNAAENGIYIMDTGPWERARDFDSVLDIRQGTRLFVYAGSTMSGGYIVTTSIDPSTFEMDDDDIEFEESLGGDFNFGVLDGINRIGVSVASATTINLTNTTGDIVDITGSTGPIGTITLAEGKARWVRFTSTPTITHSSTLVLPTSDDIEAAAGDFALFIGYAGGVVRCAHYQRASGRALRDSSNVTSLLSVLTSAEVTDVLNGTNAIDITAKIKAWISAAPSGSILDATMLNGTVTLTSALFTDHTLPVTLRTGKVELTMEFNDSGGHRIPSFCTWEMNGTTITPTAKINNIGGSNFPVHTSPALGMVQTYWGGLGRTCSGTNGASTITVSDATGLHVGSRLAILNILADTTLTYTLTNNETSGATSIELTGAHAAEINPMFGAFLIDSEIMVGLFSSGAMDTSATFLGDTGGRGALGTTAASHSAGATVTVLQSALFLVTAISGTTITLDQTLPRSFTNARFRFGAVNARLTGYGEIDGELNRSDLPSNVWECFSSVLGSGCSSSGQIRLRRGVTGGIMIRGCKDCHFDFDMIQGCGNPGSSLGSSSWFFGANYDCAINARRVDDGYLGMASDNKSAGVTSFGLDLPNFRCSSYFDEVTSHGVALDVTGSHNGVHIVGYSDTTDASVGIFDGTPQSDAIPPVGNYVRIETQNIYRAITGNSLANNTIVDYPPQATLTDAATITWDLAYQPSATITMVNNRTMGAATNQVAGKTYVLIIKQDGTGGRTLAWNANYRFPGGSDPVLSTGIGAVDVISFISDGSVMYGLPSFTFS